MNKLYILIIVFLTFIAAVLFRSIFFGEKSYEIKNQLKSENVALRSRVTNLEGN